ncbi:hypothetical protein D3C74_73670 [compost metagenome]
MGPSGLLGSSGGAVYERLVAEETKAGRVQQARIELAAQSEMHIVFQGMYAGPTTALMMVRIPHFTDTKIRACGNESLDFVFTLPPVGLLVHWKIDEVCSASYRSKIIRRGIPQCLRTE